MKNRAWLFALVISALAFGTAITVFFRDWVRDSIVTPLAFLFWVIGLMLQSIDQAVYWGMLIVTGSLIAFYVLWPSTYAPERAETARSSATHSRYYQWHSYFSNLEESQFAGDSLARELVRFTVTILAFQQNLSPDEIYRQIDSGEIALPEEFLAFLRRRAFINQPKPEPAWLEFFHHYFPRSRVTHSWERLSPIEQEAETILGHIEALIEPQQILLEDVLDQPTSQHADS